VEDSPDVKWADGADLTARDFAFGLEIMKDRENPLAGAITLACSHPDQIRLELSHHPENVEQEPPDGVVRAWP
jgi:ABC-type transport system substrate-binding protein